MDEHEIVRIYEKLIVAKHTKHLVGYGVRLPKLKRENGAYTIDALTLVYLARNYPNTEWVTKEDLTEFIRRFHPSTNDVQSARHLGMQSGFYIVSSRRGNYHPEGKSPPSKNCYLLVSLEEPHPAFVSSKRTTSQEDDFELIKRRFDYRCATCGSKEGEANLRYRKVRTQLQQGHRNPKQSLKGSNLIPQCQFCNRADRNNWVYDKRGRVIAVASIKPIKQSIQKGYLHENEVKSLHDYLTDFLRTLSRHEDGT